MKFTYYCPRGHNVFDTDIEFGEHEGPECGSCGRVMRQSPDAYDRTRAELEDLQIAEYEARYGKKE